MEAFWNIWWLRLMKPDHWTRDGWRPHAEREEEFAQIFFGRSLAWLNAEDRYDTIYPGRGAIPDGLWPAGRFPKFQWLRDELEESGHAYIHGDMIHPLFHASELERIREEFPLRFKESRPCYSKAELKKLGYSAAQIESLAPYAEALNRLSYQWYPLYLKSEVDQIQPARVRVPAATNAAAPADTRQQA